MTRSHVGQVGEVGGGGHPGQRRVPLGLGSLALLDLRLSDFSSAATVASAVDWLRERSTTSNPLTAAVSAIPDP